MKFLHSWFSFPFKGECISKKINHFGLYFSFKETCINEKILHFRLTLPINVIGIN